MTPTPVGMRCPECASQRTKVVRGVGEESLFSRAPATFILIAINAAVFLAEIASGGGGFYEIRGSSLVFDYGLFGPLVNEGEWYRLVTSGFLHAGLIHVGFNMFALFFLGRILEPSVGTPRFLGDLCRGAAGRRLRRPAAQPGRAHDRRLGGDLRHLRRHLRDRPRPRFRRRRLLDRIHPGPQPGAQRRRLPHQPRRPPRWPRRRAGLRRRGDRGRPGDASATATSPPSSR